MAAAMNAQDGHSVSGTLRLREGAAKEIEGTVEVVYADSWDDLCEAASDLANALETIHKHALRHDPDYPGSQHEEKAHQALRKYHDA